MATLAGERRKFEITVFKNKATGDTTQIPAQSITVKLYKEGATVTSTGVDPATLTLVDLGDIALGDTLKIWDGTQILAQTLDVDVIYDTDPPTIDVTINGGSVTFAGGERIFPGTAVTVYDNDRTDDAAATDSTNSLGYFSGWVGWSNVDVHLSGTGIDDQLKVDIGGPSRVSYVVTDHGLVGDGATNDGTALNALVAKAVRSKARFKEIKFPAGTYFINTQVDIDGGVATASGLAFTGDPGAVIKFAHNGAATCFTMTKSGGAHTDYVFRGLTFEGAGSATASEKFMMWLVAGNDDDGYLRRLSILNCVFRDFPADTKSHGNAIGMGRSSNGGDTYVQDVIIDGCVFDNLDGRAIYIGACTGVSITNCMFRDTYEGVVAYTQTAAGKLNNISIEQCKFLSQNYDCVKLYTSNDYAPDPAQSDFRISGCHFHHGSATSVYEGIKAVCLTRVIVTTCTFKSIDNAGVSLWGCQSSQVSGCEFSDTTNTAIAILKTDVNGGAGSYTSNGILIMGNGSDNDDSGIAAIYTKDANDVTVSGNFIQNYTEYAIAIDKATSTADIFVTGNHCVSKSSGSGSIYVVAGATNAVVANNKVDSSISTDTSVRLVGNMPIGSATQFSNASFEYQNAMMKWTDGSYAWDGPSQTITLGEDGNYFELGVGVVGVTINTMVAFQAGTFVAIRNASGGNVTWSGTADNIKLPTTAGSSFAQPNNDVLYWVCDGTNWRIAGVTSRWSYNATTQVLSATSARISLNAGSMPFDWAAGVNPTDWGVSSTSTLSHGASSPGWSVNSGIKIQPSFSGAGTVARHFYMELSEPPSGTNPTNAYLIATNSSVAAYDNPPRRFLLGPHSTNPYHQTPTWVDNGGGAVSIPVPYCWGCVVIDKDGATPKYGYIPVYLGAYETPPA